jgi:hypothetical protein
VPAIPYAELLQLQKRQGEQEAAPYPSQLSQQPPQSQQQPQQQPQQTPDQSPPGALPGATSPGRIAK